MEEYSGKPGVPGQFAWTRDVDADEAEKVLQNWLQGKIPPLENWTKMERSGRTLQQVLERQERGIAHTPSQPHRDWPWLLTVGGYTGSTSDPNWTDIEENLRELSQETDSYLILEQRAPENPEQSWFIQCAMALQGPDAGQYAVEIGCSDPAGPLLWERMVPDVRDAIEYFSKAYNHRELDVSGFREI